LWRSATKHRPPLAEIMQVLDSAEIDISGKHYKIDGLSNLMDRVRHCAVDVVTIIVLTHLVSEIISYFVGVQHHPQRHGYFWIIFSCIYFPYYILLEFFWLKTLGKFFNKTIVMNENERRPTFIQILIRSIIRPTILGTFLIESNYNRTLHDLLSRTYTIRIKKLK